MAAVAGILTRLERLGVEPLRSRKRMLMKVLGGVKLDDAHRGGRCIVVVFERCFFSRGNVMCIASLEASSITGYFFSFRVGRSEQSCRWMMEQGPTIAGCDSLNDDRNECRMMVLHLTVSSRQKWYYCF